MIKDPEYPIHTMSYEDMKEVDWQFNHILVVYLNFSKKHFYTIK